MLAFDNLARAFYLARGTLALFGLAAVLVVALPEPRDALLRQALASTTTKDEAAVAAKVVVPVAAPVPMAEPIRHTAASESARDVEQRALAEYIARRYRVAESASSAFVSTAYHAGREHSVDPLLILAVMAIESGYNPVAESSMGAKGLMQIIPRFHQEKLFEHGGELALLDPKVNIQVGARILREYMRRFGATEAALQMYGGAMDEPTAQYAGKVLAEKARLLQFVARLRRQA
jgi:soluble lytic murein transglycosylase-like protein